MLPTGIILLQFLIGFGVIDRLDIIHKPVQKVTLAIILGFFISSVVVFSLELLHIQLTLLSVLIALSLTSLALNSDPRLLFRQLRVTFSGFPGNVRVYEIIFFLVAGYLLFHSAWRTYAVPVTPYDSIVGIDLVARQAVREGHIVSSVFSRPDFRPFLSTQPYYAPFTMLMQIIFRFGGLPFGQIWLGILTIAFFAFAYSKLCDKMHPVIAGFFVLLFITAPELYAYTFLLQTDFANAVFFSIAMIFIIEYLETNNRQHFILSVILMAAACWTRTETIILVIPICAVISLRHFTKPALQSFQKALSYFGICVTFNVLWNILFFRYYLPVVPEVKDQINWKGIYSWEKSGDILKGMNAYFFNTDYWGYAIHIFLGLWLVNLMFNRCKQSMWDFLWIVVLYLSFFVMLHHFTLMNIEYTFRRGIMKFLLLMCLLLSRFPILQRRIIASPPVAMDKR